MHHFEPASFGLPSTPAASCALSDENQTRALGRAVAAAMLDGGFVGLVGELGAGKTTFVQGLVEELSNGQQTISSPTYTLVNEYDVGPGVYHFDLYRLEDADDLEGVAYWDYVSDETAIVLVEWIDRIPAAWFGRGVVIELIHEPCGRIARLWADQPAEAWTRAFDLP